MFWPSVTLLSSPYEVHIWGPMVHGTLVHLTARTAIDWTDPARPWSRRVFRKCCALWICRHSSWLRATICLSRIPAKIIHVMRTIWHTSLNYWVQYHDPSLWWANTHRNSSQSAVSHIMPLPSIQLRIKQFFWLHCLHTVHKMRPIGTDVTHSMVCLPVFVAHGWAVQKWVNWSRCHLGADHGSRNHVLDGGQDLANPFRDDKLVMQLFARLLQTLV